MTVRVLILVVLLGAAVPPLRSQADGIAGKWTASFETQIGNQTYTYEFVVKGSELTGKAKSNLGEATITEGKVDGDKVTFVELLKFQDMELRITYSGKIASPDEIAFTRQVGDIATEELIARRAK
jgi:hypothetical protein